MSFLTAIVTAEMMLPGSVSSLTGDAEPKTIASYKSVDFETLFLGFGPEGKR